MYSDQTLNDMQMNRPAIAVAAPQFDVNTETFIRAHIERLPAQVLPLYGGEDHLPRYYNEGQPISRGVGLPRRMIRKAQRWLFRLSWDHFPKADIAALLRRNRVQAVLAEYGPTGVIMMEVCQWAHIPLAVHFFGYDAYTESILRGVGQSYPQLFAAAAAIIAVSRDMVEQLARLGAPRAKLHHVPCGADTALFQMTDAAANPPTFVAVGRFVDKKAPYLTLLAFWQVLQKVPTARMVMVGDGPLWETCRRLSQALGIHAVVAFPGRLPHSELAELLRKGRAFVQHSVRAFSGDSEGTPVAVLEAGASGLPVVATRHAGIQDVVVHEQTGLLVDEGDVEGMAQAMLRLAMDASLAGRLGRAARVRVERYFQLDDTIARLWGVIESSCLHQGTR